MRTELAGQMLDDELEVLRDALPANTGVTAWREGTDVFVAFPAGRDGQPGLFRLGCAKFDAEPPTVAMLDPQTREELPLERWTPGVPHSIHPVTGKPFVCLQGTAEYHSHPSHLQDSWDRYRPVFRLAQTVRVLLTKAGVTVG
jgi:hypothetical protein